MFVEFSLAEGQFLSSSSLSRRCDLGIAGPVGSGPILLKASLQLR